MNMLLKTLFAEIIKNDIFDPDEEYVSYDVESLFTSMQVSETIDYTVKPVLKTISIKQPPLHNDHSQVFPSNIWWYLHYIERQPV